MNELMNISRHNGVGISITFGISNCCVFQMAIECSAKCVSAVCASYFDFIVPSERGAGMSPNVIRLNSMRTDNRSAPNDRDAHNTHNFVQRNHDDTTGQQDTDITQSVQVYTPNIWAHLWALFGIIYSIRSDPPTKTSNYIMRAPRAPVPVQFRLRAHASTCQHTAGLGHTCVRVCACVRSCRAQLTRSPHARGVLAPVHAVPGWPANTRTLATCAVRHARREGAHPEQV